MPSDHQTRDSMNVRQVVTKISWFHVLHVSRFAALLSMVNLRHDAPLARALVLAPPLMAQ
jgi:hypothetical protein